VALAQRWAVAMTLDGADAANSGWAVEGRPKVTIAPARHRAEARIVHPSERTNRVPSLGQLESCWSSVVIVAIPKGARAIGRSVSRGLHT